MTFRRIFLLAVAVFLSVLAWTVKDLTSEPAKIIAGSVLWCLIVVLMLPSERFNVSQLITVFKMWKGEKDDK